MLGLIINKYRDFKKFHSLGITFSFWKKYRKKSENIVFEVPFLGRKISGFNPYWFFHSVEEIFLEHIYVFRINYDNPRILDFGSNLGLSIIYFKRIFPNASILGFEPDPIVFYLLEKNLKEFNISNCEVFNKAVWDSNCDLEFHRDDLLGGFITTNDSSLGDTENISIKAIDASELLSQPVDFLKMDIEGAELIVLNSIKGKLNLVQNMFIEYHSKIGEVQKLDDILLIISNAGFRYYIKEAYSIYKFPFIRDNQHLKYDLQLNIFCYRT